MDKFQYKPGDIITYRPAIQTMDYPQEKILLVLQTMDNDTENHPQTALEGIDLYRLLDMQYGEILFLSTIFVHRNYILHT